MSLYSDLTEQAEHLAKREPKRPRQASLRRAVSSAYYAIFHMLIADGTLKFIPHKPPLLQFIPHKPPLLRPQAQRAFVHGEMKKACEQFAKSSGPGNLAHLVTAPIEPELMRLAAAFVELQEARHAADYDLSESFDRVSVLQTIDQAKKAISDWKIVRNNSNANVFLASLLLHQRWAK